MMQSNLGLLAGISSVSTVVENRVFLSASYSDAKELDHSPLQPNTHSCCKTRQLLFPGAKRTVLAVK